MNPFKKMKFKAMLRNCNYTLAGTVIKQQYYDINKNTEINRLIDQFLDNPGFEEALKLIEYNDMMVFYFTESCTDGLYVRKTSQDTGRMAAITAPEPNPPAAQPQFVDEDTRRTRIRESEEWMNSMIARERPAKHAAAQTNKPGTSVRKAEAAQRAPRSLDDEYEQEAQETEMRQSAAAPLDSEDFGDDRSEPAEQHAQGENSGDSQLKSAKAEDRRSDTDVDKSGTDGLGEKLAVDPYQTPQSPGMETREQRIPNQERSPREPRPRVIESKNWRIPSSESAPRDPREGVSSDTGSFRAPGATGSISGRVPGSANPSGRVGSVGLAGTGGSGGTVDSIRSNDPTDTADSAGSANAGGRAGSVKSPVPAAAAGTVRPVGAANTARPAAGVSGQADREVAASTEQPAKSAASKAPAAQLRPSFPNVTATLKIDLNTMVKQKEEYRRQLLHNPSDEKRLKAWIQVLDEAIREFSLAIDILEGDA